MRKGPNDREARMSRRQVLISIGGAALLSLSILMFLKGIEPGVVSE